MADLSHCIYTDKFTDHQASLLILGVDPSTNTNEIDAGHIRERIAIAYEGALKNLRFQFLVEPCLPDDWFDEHDLKTETVDRKLTLMSLEMERLCAVFHYSDELSMEHWLEHGRNQLHEQMFSRQELARWISENNYPSKYQFASTSKIQSSDEAKTSQEARALSKVVSTDVARLGKDLYSLVELWFCVADILAITVKQAYWFVEEKIFEFDIDFWIDDRYTGLWRPLVDSIAVNKKRGFLDDVWESAESFEWKRESLLEWEFLKIVPDDFFAIKNAAMLISDSSPSGSSNGSASFKKNHLEYSSEEIDPLDLPAELDAANMAFRAIDKGYGDQSKTARNRLIDYLKKHYPHFKPEQVKRIATVVNPDKTTGRKKIGKE